MKKLLTILLSVLCLFLVAGVNISAEDEDTPTTIKYPDDKDINGNTTGSTTIVYTVSNSYSWSIPSELDANEKTELDVKLLECSIDSNSTLNIVVKSSSVSDKVSSWSLRSGDIKVNYIIKNKSNDDVWHNEYVVLTNPGTNPVTAENIVTATGVFAWNTAAPTAAGIYEDTLTFTASIVTPE